MNQFSLSPVRPALLSLQGINLSLSGNAGNVAILHDIGLTVHENESVALVGPSGSGKTSLLMVIAGLEQATSGQIVFKNEDITRLNEDQLAHLRSRHMGIVFQSFHLIPTMTALENVAIPLEFAGDKEARAKAEDVLAALGLGHRIHHYPSELSGGEQQRVAIARAFAPQPTLLLADEPTGNLDHETGEHVIKLLFDLQQQYRSSLLLITHDPALAKRCDRTVKIADGRLSIPSPAKAGEG